MFQRLVTLLNLKIFLVDMFIKIRIYNGICKSNKPKAKKFKDLSMSEQAIFKQNALKQNADSY